MKWIKASERLPNNKNICFRWRTDSNTYAYSNGIAFDNLVSIEPDCEWLDESLPDDEKDKEIERLKGLIEKMWKEEVSMSDYSPATYHQAWQQFKTNNSL